MKRLAFDPQKVAQENINRLVARGILPERAARHTLKANHAPDFDHAGLRTFIYPEEGLLLAAISEAVLPRRALFLGSCYGY